MKKTVNHSLLSARAYEQAEGGRIPRESRPAFHLTPDRHGEIQLHVFLDRFSVEAFINDGEQVITATVPTGSDARGISFETDGRAVMDITKYTLSGGV